MTVRLYLTPYGQETLLRCDEATSITSDANAEQKEILFFIAGHADLEEYQTELTLKEIIPFIQASASVSEELKEKFSNAESLFGYVMSTFVLGDDPMLVIRIL